jgi:hypothetical protein
MVVSAIRGRKATEICDHWFGIIGFLPEKWQEQSKLFFLIIHCCEAVPPVFEHALLRKCGLNLA